MSDFEDIAGLFGGSPVVKKSKKERQFGDKEKPVRDKEKPVRDKEKPARDKEKPARDKERPVGEKPPRRHNPKKGSEDRSAEQIPVQRSGEGEASLEEGGGEAVQL